MNTLDFIINKYQLIPNSTNIVEIPNTNRETFTHLLAQLGLSVGAEIGVEAGIYSKLLCDANPEKIDLYSIDAWTAYKGYRDHVSQEEVDKLQVKARERLSSYIAGGKCTLIKGFSVEVAKQFKDESLDFVYIDGNHEFQQTVNDIAEWHPKVKVGGIVAGHDYILRNDPGYLMHVPMAVEGYCKSYNIKPLFILGAKSDQKPPGGIRDNTRSWFYVKPEPWRIKAGSGHKIHQ